MQPTINYRSPDRAPSGRAVLAAAAVGAIVVSAANAGLLLVAFKDQSYVALGIMFMVGPVTNGVLALLSLPFIPLVRRASGGAAVTPYVLSGTLLPMAAIAVDAACIHAMSLHGC